MSESPADRWKKVETLFARAVALPDDQRQAFLQIECGDDTELFAEVKGLLDADSSDDPIDDIVIDAAQQSVAGAADAQIGKTLGNYQLKGLLGEGGMGSVFLAERSDDQFRQQVAIKVLSAYRPSKDLIQRLRAERQILANLNHKNIAKLLDGGSTADGLPYIAMEYIKGQPIDQYCDENKLSIAARLRLFCKVCDAVDHAHRNLIVHRDLKPGNILIDHEGEPKLLDFGIAKILDSARTSQTLAVTRQGALLLTPQYASPEQVRGEPPAIATDVYSLGVLLYRLLTGHSPYGKSTESPVELEKAIVEADPPKPSTIVVAAVDAEHPDATAQESSEQRGTSPERLRKRLLGDLDNIVLKTLQKDPQRRYATTQILQRDIENFLQDRPVSARPDSMPYRLGKAIRRNRLTVATGSAFLATIVALVSFYTLQLADERDRARLEANRAEQVAVFLTDLFEEANPANNFGEPMNARQLLDTGAARVADELDDQPELKAALVATIGDSYLKMRENKAGHEYLAPMLSELEAELGKEHQTVLKIRRHYANSMLNIGDAASARSIFVEDYAAWQRLTGPDSIESGIALQRVAQVEANLGNDDKAERHFLDAIDLLRGHGAAATHDLVATLMDYGVLLRSLNRIEEEEPLLVEALALEEGRVGTEHVDYAGIINNLGSHYHSRGNIDTAAEYFEQHLVLQRKLVGENAVAYASALMNMATILSAQSRLNESLEMMDEALVIFRNGYGEDSIRFAYLTENRANALMNLRRYEESDAAFQVALGIIGEKFGTDHREYAFTQGNYGNMLQQAGRFEDGIEQLNSSFAINKASYGSAHRRIVQSGHKLANALRAYENLDAALEVAVETVSAAREVWQGPHPDYVSALAVLAHTHRDRREFSDAENYYVEAIEMASLLEGDSLREVITLESSYAKGLIAAGRNTEARSLLESRANQISSFDETWDNVRKYLADTLALITED